MNVTLIPGLRVNVIMESWTMSFTTIYFVPVDSDEEDEEDESHSSREVKMLDGK